jgi:hypothetical protein
MFSHELLVGVKWHVESWMSSQPLLHLGAVQRLDLALLIHAQHDGAFRRVEIETNDRLHLLGELGIVTHCECT